jgi:hypothetical protein
LAITPVSGRKESVVSAWWWVEDVVEVVRWEEEVKDEEDREREWLGMSKVGPPALWEESGRVGFVDERLVVVVVVVVVGVGGSGRASSDSSFMSMFQIRTVWSAEQVARSLMSGERRRRVR